jgi:hypothetical protein
MPANNPKPRRIFTDFMKRFLPLDIVNSSFFFFPQFGPAKAEGRTTTATPFEIGPHSNTGPILELFIFQKDRLFA